MNDIETKLKKLNQKLKESEEKYKNLVEKSGLSIIIFDKDGKSLLVNKLTADNLGKKPEDLIGKSIFEFLPKDKAKKYLKMIRDVIESRKAITTEDIFKLPDGIRTFFINIQPIFDINGNVTSTQNISIEITKRKKIEQKLKESETIFRAIADQSLIALCIIQNNLIKYCNQRLGDITGYNIEEMMNWTPEELIKSILPAYRDFVIEQMKKRQEGSDDAIDQYELQFFRKNGEKIWIEIISKGINYKGAPADLGIILDITERKRIEQILKDSEKKYKIERDNLINILNSMEDGVYIIDQKHNLEYANPILIKDFGPFEGKKCYYYFHGRKEVCPLCKNKEVFTGKTIKWEWFSSEYQKTYDLVETPVKNPDGSQSKLVIFHDITERKKIEQELIKQNIELTKLDRAKNNFITMATHELKTPLISIAGYTEYILTKHKENLSIDIKNDLLIVQRNIDRLQNLINQLLDVIKMESDKMELNLELINITDIMYRCLNELSYLIKEKDHEMILNIDNEIFLNIDPDRIFQVFSNLISNAAKFTPKGGRIEISAKKEDSRYLFEVKDNGIGLSKNELKCVFEKFETVKQDKNENFPTGTGLGLYLSKGLVKAHGGKMWGTSEGRNKGSTFYFSLPIIKK
ncbi:MAG: PAS domain S-box protein [Candidatus Hodarchaeota archaeon]